MTEHLTARALEEFRTLYKKDEIDAFFARGDIWEEEKPAEELTAEDLCNMPLHEYKRRLPEFREKFGLRRYDDAAED